MLDAQPTADTRCATASDVPFLRAMLFEAAYWRPSLPRPSLEAGLERPDLSKLLAGWGRLGDHAAIAVDPHGVPLGAAWYRFWTVEDYSYGFVRTDTPEVGIGVVAHARGKGVGTLLLEALLTHGAHAGIPCLSLSVEVDNPAHRLYERLGFRSIQMAEGAMTMLAATRVVLRRESPLYADSRSAANPALQPSGEAPAAER